MKVLFVSSGLSLVEPLGIMYLSALLKEGGHETKLIQLEQTNALDKIISYHPDIIAYSCATGMHKFYLDFNLKMKGKFKFNSIFGGPHFTFFPETVEENGVDAICVGEGEYALLDYVNALDSEGKLTNYDIPNLWIKKSDGSIKKNTVRDLLDDLDKISFPDREILYESDEFMRNQPVKRFYAIRGCPYQCTYCFNKGYNNIYKGKGKIVRKRTVENVLGEILEVKRNYPLEFVRFVDDTFNIDAKWLEEFSEKYRGKVNLPFSCNIRADIVSEKTARNLKQANCSSVFMAIETGNEEMRYRLLKRKISNEKLIKSVLLIKNENIKVFTQNILGLPGGSLEKDLETLALNIRCKPSLAGASLLLPYPKTEIAAYAIENNYFHGDFSKVPMNMVQVSLLNFKSEEEKTKIQNLQKLFGIIVSFPFLLPLAKILIRFNFTRIYTLLGNYWLMYCLKFRIIPVSFSLKQYWQAYKKQKEDTSLLFVP